jgi:hypothetical protein
MWKKMKIHVPINSRCPLKGAPESGWSKTRCNITVLSSEKEKEKAGSLPT